ncbi:hypothetical protein [Ensifer canadensis]
MVSLIVCERRAICFALIVKVDMPPLSMSPAMVTQIGAYGRKTILRTEWSVT